MSDDFKIPDGARIGHVHLKVSDLKKSLDFYCGLLGFELITTYGDEAAFISAGGYHHHIGLNVWYSKNQKPAPNHQPGLFHTAILMPERRDLAIILDRLLKAKYPLTGFADHGVSEAIYLNDPDKNGVEIYWDKPKKEWPIDPDGKLTMYTRPLDTDELLKTFNLK
ncbi:VOC family protein [Mangrovivirga sp. M17]|uniref:VOC family protein n=1 Tax=Mangrovivirga halotolerans TaxID=2993936 RepID=A0ABT3RQY4_9BACT|nr:VOC family protein [Mangrovivirga halotolerans]MCX2743916.1 VOC family protein [Mangrovivirga halotolerans]